MIWFVVALSILNFIFLFLIFFKLRNQEIFQRKVQEDLQKLIENETNKEANHKITTLQLENIEKDIRDESKEIKELSSKYAYDSRNELKASIKDFKEEIVTVIKDLKEESTRSLKANSDALTNHVRDLAVAQQNQLNSFKESLTGFGDNNLKQLQNLQESNEKKLEEMRLTVDEKLQSTLEKRLDNSFKLVSDRLEKVHAGLGEMQNLANGVGDLKKVLTNVKSRGTWGEMQLANLLEDVMAPDQFEANVQIKERSQERVDFAIKLPGEADSEQPIWLPIDAKFPQEDYQKLVEARELSDPGLAELALKQLESRIKFEAKSIYEKYIDPPRTTDFALMFFPTEGLYAEVIRMPGLVDGIQRKFRVNVVGPTTLAALLNSLQLGFRTLTIQKRTSDVWKLLAEIKKHFGSFGDLLEKAEEKVAQASKVIKDAGTRSRTIETKLRKVQELPIDDKQAHISLN